jgi:hypothetical protein
MTIFKYEVNSNVIITTFPSLNPLMGTVDAK